ncbi:hypothetical protein BSKO_08211 [Bryopsis sp. KO-2023]|nr:hypothetical protein BSKO_08211 [Bryopsis sp. KO-2023]
MGSNELGNGEDLNARRVDETINFEEEYVDEEVEEYEDPMYRGEDEEEEVDQPGPVDGQIYEPQYEAEAYEPQYDQGVEQEDGDYYEPEAVPAEGEDYQGRGKGQGSALARRTAPRRQAAVEANGYMVDEVQGGSLEEAFEDDGNIDRMLTKTRKKNKFKLTHGEIQQICHELVNKMEAAAEKDLNLHSHGKIAMEKLKLIPELEETLIRRDFQQFLLEEGILGVLKAWIEPLSDGTLPNIKVRTTVLNCLKQLPIDTRDQESREYLKNSDVGSRVMFLSRISAETRENRKLASELVQRWARPIFAERVDEAQEEEMIRETLNARKRRLEQEREEELRDHSKKLKPGDPGYRHTARIPAPSRLDYVIKPLSRVNPDEAKLVSKKNPVMVKLNKIQRRKTLVNGRSMQAVRPSIEGRK